MNFNEKFLNQMQEVISRTNYSEIEKIVEEIGSIKKNNGRIFFCGSGGGAGHASHAAADFKKLLNIESYSVTDNVSFLTAAINDIGWETSYTEVLKSSNFTSNDALFVFSVGGGSIEPLLVLRLLMQLTLFAQLVVKFSVLSEEMVGTPLKKEMLLLSQLLMKILSHRTQKECKRTYGTFW